MHSNLLLALNYQWGSTRESLFAEARRWAQRHAEPLAREIGPHANARVSGRRLRVGYVTADFRQHASAFFLLPLLEHHDARRVELFCYSDVARPDGITARCRAAAHHWRETAGVGDARLAEMIRRDGIDILVDLKLHADQNRLLVFARKPAPVQVTWLGYPGTTGLTAIDYRLSDPHLDPSSQEDVFYAEKTVRLPHTFWCYDPLSAEPVNPLPAGGGGRIAFGCLNHPSKIGEPLVALMAQVLAAVPRSTLTLLGHDGSHRVRLLESFDRRGVAAERIEFVAPRPRGDYLRLYHGIDIALDSWPVNGHTTTFDSLWMGVPVVTLAGPTPLGRAGISQLKNLGLEKLIGDSGESYVRIARELADDLPRLSALRGGLRGLMESSPLMRSADFARGVEEAFEKMWRDYCAGK
jgi:predicted O-linked N-acetylglucosamine transferase (SPINDLY family)